MAPSRASKWAAPAASRARTRRKARLRQGGGVGFSAAADLKAKLPLVGPVAVGLELENNELQSVSLKATGIPIPSGAGAVKFGGTLSGNASWNVPKNTFSGSLTGDVTVTLPAGAAAGKKLSLSFTISGGDKGGISVSGTLKNPVDITSIARISKLEASYKDGAVSFKCGASVKLPLIGPLEGEVEITENELESIKVSATDLSFDIRRGPLNIGGKLNGNAAWDAVASKLSGQLNGDLTLSLGSGSAQAPGRGGARKGAGGSAGANAAGGLSPIALSFSIGDKEGALAIDASLANPVDVTSFLKVETLSASYEGGAVSFNGSVSLNLPKVEASGEVEFNEASGFALENVSGAMTVPVLGKIGAAAKFDQLALVELAFSAQNAKFGFPSKSPIVTGTVNGGATWDVERSTFTAGSLGVSATAKVPGVAKPVPIEISLAGGEDGLTVDIELTSPVAINRFLRLDALSGSVEEGKFAILGTASLQNLGRAQGAPAAPPPANPPARPVRTGQSRRGQAQRQNTGTGAGVGGSVSIRIDESGFQVTGGGATVELQLGNAIKAKVTVKYDSTKGLTVDGTADLNFGPLSASVALKMEEGRIDAELNVPSRDGDQNKLTGAKVEPGNGLVLFDGWKLDGFKLPKLPTYDIPIFSFFGLATLTAQVGVQLDLGIEIEPLVVAGSAKVKGLNLADGTMEELLLSGMVACGIGAFIVFSPQVGLTLSLVHPKLFGITGGLALDARATAGVNFTGTIELSYKPGQGLDLKKAEIAAPFYISLSIDPKLYLQISAFFDLLSVEWRTPALASLEVLKDKKLFVVKFDLAKPGEGAQIETATADTEAPGAEVTPQGMTSKQGPGTRRQRQQSRANRYAGVEDETTKPLAEPKEAPATAKRDKAPPPADGQQKGAGESSLFDFSLLWTIIDAVLPGPIRDIKAFFKDIYEAIKSFIDGFIQFIDWISDKVNRIIETDEEVKNLLDNVLLQWNNLNWFNPIAVATFLKTVVDFALTVVRKLFKALREDGNLQVIRRRKYALGSDSLNPDAFDFHLSVPGLFSWTGTLPNVFNLVEAFCNFLGIEYIVVEDEDWEAFKAARAAEAEAARIAEATALVNTATAYALSLATGKGSAPAAGGGGGSWETPAVRRGSGSSSTPLLQDRRAQKLGVRLTPGGLKRRSS